MCDAHHARWPAIDALLAKRGVQPGQHAVGPATSTSVSPQSASALQLGSSDGAPDAPDAAPGLELLGAATACAAFDGATSAGVAARSAWSFDSCAVRHATHASITRDNDALLPARRDAPLIDAASQAARLRACSSLRRTTRDATPSDVSDEHVFPFAPGLFRDRTVLVTGGGTGIGLASALRFAALGANVAIGSRKQPNIDAGLAALSAIAPAEKTYGAPLDTRDPAAVEAFVDAVIAKFGRIDVLINNAGGQFPTAAENLAPKGWEAVIRNNLNGTWFMTHAVATKSMLPQKSGRIVNVIAQIYRGFPGMVHTGAARAGVENMTKSLAVEWAPRGVRVNAIAPGFIQSTGTAQYPEFLVERAMKASPMGRGGTPDEVARLIVFLASDQLDFVTGETWYIDGGQKLWGDVWQSGEG